MGTKRAYSSDDASESSSKRGKVSEGHNQPGLVWFRSDLRTADNPALFHGSSWGSRTIALYIISPKEWKSHNLGPFKVDFILRNLKSLSKSLAERYKIPLVIKHSESAKHTRQLVVDVAKEYGVGHVFFNQEHEMNEATRDSKVREMLSESGIECSDYLDQCIVRPGMLCAQSSGKPYSKFTPFKNSWINLINSNWNDYMTSSPEPKSNDELVPSPSTVPDSLEGFELEDRKQKYWKAGEEEAHARLKQFCSKRADKYDDARNNAAQESGTSRISAYLASGVVSIRQCALELANETKSQSLPEGKAGKAVWATELAWREFYRHIMVTNPHVCKYEAYQPWTEKVIWNDNEEHFKAWCDGKTGIPIVDAGMRQLNETGYMHNRLRMITAMFLSKNLLLDWRKGEKYFSTHLIDADLASNNGGWQWSASTGTDAAPYFRIMNAVSQAKKVDPKGEYVKKWIPELRDLPTKSIHEPHAELPSAVFKKLNYPKPIVDLKKTRAAAIEAFKAAKDSADSN